mgnify:CR=1 FL=1
MMTKMTIMRKPTDSKTRQMMLQKLKLLLKMMPEVRLLKLVKMKRNLLSIPGRKNLQSLMTAMVRTLRNKIKELREILIASLQEVVASKLTRIEKEKESSRWIWTMMMISQLCDQVKVSYLRLLDNDYGLMIQITLNFDVSRSWRLNYHPDFKSSLDDERQEYFISHAITSW